MSPKSTFTDVVKFPAITDSTGAIIFSGPEVKAMPFELQVTTAKAMGGEIITLSYSAHYTMGERVCTARDCFKSPIEGRDRCAYHKFGANP